MEGRVGQRRKRNCEKSRIKDKQRKEVKGEGKEERRMKEFEGKARAMKGEEMNRKKMKRYGRSYKVKKGEGRRWKDKE